MLRINDLKYGIALHWVVEALTSIDVRVVYAFKILDSIWVLF